MLTSPSSILVPLDFSRCAEYALQHAVSLARQYQSTVYLLYALEPPPLLSAEAGYAFEQEIMSTTREYAETMLKKHIEELTTSGIQASYHIATGVPHMAIISFAEEIHASMIVISTHGRRGIARLMMGSTTERVVRLAQCPVLSVHPPEELLVEP